MKKFIVRKETENGFEETEFQGKCKEDVIETVFQEEGFSVEEKKETKDVFIKLIDNEGIGTGKMEGSEDELIALLISAMETNEYFKKLAKLALLQVILKK